jgi:hypothetical protein
MPRNLIVDLDAARRDDEIGSVQCRVPLAEIVVGIEGRWH